MVFGLLLVHYGGFVGAPVTAVGSDHVRQSHCENARLVSGGWGHRQGILPERQDVGVDGTTV